MLKGASAMYLQNKYTKYYYSIIEKASTRTLGKDDVVEKHHIIPKSLGGLNNKDNISILTPKEHFICHLLLPKMTEGLHKSKMYHALSMMLAKPKQYNRNYKITSNVYDLVKKKISENMKEYWKDSHNREERSKKYSGINNPFAGKTHSEKSLQKMRNREFSKETRNLMSNSQKTRFENSPGTFSGRKHTNETREKMRLSRIGKKDSEEIKKTKSIAAKKRPPVSDETRKKLSYASKLRSEDIRNYFLARPKKICYYCNREIDYRNYAQWHGEKCKKKE
jgi:hypothetical protein